MTDNIRKSDFVNPLGVLVNGKSFKLNGDTHEGFDELKNYLKEIIGSNRQAVERYCDQKYEQIGYTWYELMHEYINTEYDYIIHAIASNYCDYIWNSCFHGGKLDWDDYFGIRAEWESGGYGVRKSSDTRRDKARSIRKMEKDKINERLNDLFFKFVDEYEEKGLPNFLKDGADELEQAFDNIHSGQYRSAITNLDFFMNKTGYMLDEVDAIIQMLIQIDEEGDTTVYPTFEMFKNTIEQFLGKYKSEGWDLTDYTFHDLGNGHYTFSFDGTLYELINYGIPDASEYGLDPYSFRHELSNALEEAGFEWGVNIEHDTYSDIGFYDHNVTKSAKKSKTVKKMDYTIFDSISEVIRVAELELDETPENEKVMGFLYEAQSEYASNNVYKCIDYLSRAYQTCHNTKLERMIEGLISSIKDSDDYVASARKSEQYSPNYLGFNDMVNKLRNTRNNRNVFKD